MFILLIYVWPAIGLFALRCHCCILWHVFRTAKNQWRYKDQCMSKRLPPKLLKAIVMWELCEELIRRMDWSCAAVVLSYNHRSQQIKKPKAWHLSGGWGALPACLKHSVTGWQRQWEIWEKTAWRSPKITPRSHLHHDMQNNSYWEFR